MRMRVIVAAVFLVSFAFILLVTDAANTAITEEDNEGLTGHATASGPKGFGGGRSGGRGASRHWAPPEEDNTYKEGLS
jgi:hypothetical protein